MRQILLATCALFAMTSLAIADSFPGPVVKAQAPFNNKNVITLSQASCPGTYDQTMFATMRSKITTNVKACIAKYFGITEDLGLDFGIDNYSECIVPANATSGKKTGWPVCCAVGDVQARSMVCRFYIIPG